MVSLYNEYLDAKMELFEKELNFKNAVEEWFTKSGLNLLQPIDIVDSATIDHFTITTTGEFDDMIDNFEETFGVMCVRIVHQSIMVPDEYMKHVWKFHFREGVIKW